MNFSNLEQLFYWKVWVLSICYGLLQFNQACKQYLFALNPGDFMQGWTILHRMKDNSDLEWNIMTGLFKSYWLIMGFQVFCALVLFKKCIGALPIFYTFYSSLCLTVIIGKFGTALYIIYIMIMFIAHKSGRKSICYFVTLCALLLLFNQSFLNIKDKFIEDENQSFLFDVGLAWLLAKCLSFSIDSISSGAYRRSTFKEICSIVSYCLYLPTVFTGPILSYERFLHGLYLKPALKNCYRSLQRILYIIFWYFAYEFLLHFLYSSTIQFYPKIVSRFDGWALCGLGYALPMMFYLKYFVLYGMAGNIASLEGFDFPPPPKCISCIHTSTFLWRHFDRGLYLWIRKYLYFPLLGSKWTAFRKLIALFVCFGFVCLWHGMDKAVTTWCILNFILVSTENVLQTIISSRHFSKGSKFQTRIKALFTTPHFLLMCLSCVFFLSNWDIGILFMKRILSGELVPLLPLLCIMYCGCQVSIFCKRYQMNLFNF